MKSIKQLLKNTLAVLIGGIVAIIAYLGFSDVSSAALREFVIIDRATSQRYMADPLDGKVLGRIPAGTKVQILEKREVRSGAFTITWYRVKYKGKDGWISQYSTMGNIITEDVTTGKTSTVRAPNADMPKMINPSILNKGYMKASGNLWTGVQLYFGPAKMYVGEVLGGNENYTDPDTGQTFRGVKLRMKSGSMEWKDRNAIISGDWYVKESDPAITRKEWQEYKN